MSDRCDILDALRDALAQLAAAGAALSDAELLLIEAQQDQIPELLLGVGGDELFVLIRRLLGAVQDLMIRAADLDGTAGGLLASLPTQRIIDNA